MMTILFKNLTVIDPEFRKTGDFYFDGQRLHSDFPSNQNADHVFDTSGCFASKGWIDLRVGLGEPGLEYKETVESLCESLQASGFCAAVILPNTDPVIQSKNEIDFLKSKSARFLPELIIQGAVTKNTNGEDLTEILDMHYQTGISIFGDGTNTLHHADRYLKVLQYLQKFNGILFDHPFDPLLAIFGQMHEGKISTNLGLKGLPAMAEEIAVHRNLELMRYAGGRVHFQTLSTAKSVELIRMAKKEGLNVSADVSIAQLLFSDEDLKDFDPNYKVMPPFRGSKERAALIQGLKDGTIDAICSNHQPQDLDSKFMEFDLANLGQIGLQTFLPGMVKLAEELSWDLLIQKITSGPAKVLNRELGENWTIFDPTANWVYSKDTNKSLASNHPWFGQELTGKVKFVIQKGQLAQIDE
ncbi:dihydroorotase [Algoriphagus hitonicola]|uniref:Dihydroorotase n=1 Tax=Algoriphagus hitonicola TaxID=435880 RepID=A0A1I2XZ23_9BACT|nr:dihydroorotase [Algoriphagus hitonicola]SFH17321.1 dihydroorotase [Algoriphagus hitonicola]